VAVGAAADNPIVGKWDVTATDTGGHVTTWILAVKEDAGKLSGSLIGAETTLELVDPEPDVQVFTFKIMINDQPYQIETRIDGKRLEGKYKGPEASGTVKAGKQS